MITILLPLNHLMKKTTDADLMTNSNSSASVMLHFPTPPLTLSSKHIYKKSFCFAAAQSSASVFPLSFKAVTAFLCRQTKPADAA